MAPSENLNSEHIIKVNIWATEQIDWDFFDAEWDNYSRINILR